MSSGVQLISVAVVHVDRPVSFTITNVEPVKFRVIISNSGLIVYVDPNVKNNSLLLDLQSRGRV